MPCKIARFRIKERDLSFSEGDSDNEGGRIAARTTRIKKYRSATRIFLDRRHHPHDSQSSGDLSKCVFLENDTDDRRNYYRKQMARACKEYALDSTSMQSTDEHSQCSTDKVLSKEHDQFASQASRVRRQHADNNVLTWSELHSQPAWQRRTIFMQRKESRHRKSASISSWAFAQEDSTRRVDLHVDETFDRRKKLHTHKEQDQLLSMNVRRKRPRQDHDLSLDHGENNLAHGVDTERARKIEKSRNGLLDILGHRPQNTF